MSRLKDVMKVTTVKGPWFSLGFHVDFQKRYVDLHILWWIVTIGRDYYGPEDEQMLVPFVQTAVPYEPVPPTVTTNGAGRVNSPNTWFHADGREMKGKEQH